ncbi:hypothetical protein JHK85_036655 [Glycine max]|nr:hypothetical protein JHK85_036655 [Glycine max]
MKAWREKKHSTSKRGIDPTAVDYFDAAISFKRGRINNATHDVDDGQHATFELQNPTSLSLDPGGPSAINNDNHRGEEKQGKRPLFQIDFISKALLEAELGLAQNSDDKADMEPENENVDMRYVPMSFYRRNRNMERFRMIAKKNATHYARFDSEVEDEGTSSYLNPRGIVDGSETPFSDAM